MLPKHREDMENFGACVLNSLILKTKDTAIFPAKFSNIFLRTECICQVQSQRCHFSCFIRISYFSVISTYNTGFLVSL